MRQIIKQPNGLYCVWSTFTDDFILVNVKADDIICMFIEEKSYEIEAEVNEVISKLETGKKPYFQFTLTFNEAIRKVKDRYGKRASSLRNLRDKGVIK